eukprot:scaffold62560_cov33-Phaeocystis_antarctica.AAC.1
MLRYRLANGRRRNAGLGNLLGFREGRLLGLLALLALRLALGRALRLVLGLVAPVELGHRVGLAVSVRDHHRLLVKGEALHLPHGLRGGRDVSENDERLSPHLEGLERDHVKDGAELREGGVEALLELVLGDLLVDVVDVDGFAGRGLRHPVWPGGGLLGTALSRERADREP